MTEPVPRLAPERPLPPYTFVPGQTPHPVSDPRGHHYGMPAEPAEPLDLQNWSACGTYLHGFDLFNHGFFWEAHEAWERLWNACGRKGPTADVLKALIQLAAAGVKARQGQLEGVRTHAHRAAELFDDSAASLGRDRYLGLDLSELARRARGFPTSPACGLDPLVPFLLLPRD